MADGGWYPTASEARRARGEGNRVQRGSNTWRAWDPEVGRWVRASEATAAHGAPGVSAAHGAPGDDGQHKGKGKGKGQHKGKGEEQHKGKDKGNDKGKGEGKKGKGIPNTTLPMLGGQPVGDPPVGSWPYAPRAPSAAHGAPSTSTGSAARGAPSTSTGSAAHGAPPVAPTPMPHHAPSAAHGAPPPPVAHAPTPYHTPSAAHGAPFNDGTAAVAFLEGLHSPGRSTDSLPSVMSTW